MSDAWLVANWSDSHHVVKKLLTSFDISVTFQLTCLRKRTIYISHYVADLSRNPGIDVQRRIPSTGLRVDLRAVVTRDAMCKMKVACRPGFIWLAAICSTGIFGAIRGGVHPPGLGRYEIVTQT